MSNPPPAPSCAEGRPFMPSSVNGASNAHGRLRTLDTISPVVCGFSVTEPPGPCPCTPRPLTLRCTVRVSCVVLLTATTKRPKRERSASPFTKSMRTPGHFAFTPVVTTTEPSWSALMIDESVCARMTVSGPGHSVSAHAPAASAAVHANMTFFMQVLSMPSFRRHLPSGSFGRTV